MGKIIARIRSIEDRWIADSVELPDLLRKDLTDLCQMARFLDHNMQQLESSYVRECKKLQKQLELLARLARVECACQDGDTSRCQIHVSTPRVTHS
jgi:flagellar biosynthesis/type III secretory pathway chaperone